MRSEKDQELLYAVAFCGLFAIVGIIGGLSVIIDGGTKIGAIITALGASLAVGAMHYLRKLRSASRAPDAEG